MRLIKRLLLITLAAAITAKPPLCVAVVACSMHYRDFFDNWAAQLSKLELEKEIGVVAIAEDADIVDHLQQWRKSAPPGIYRRVAQSKNKQPLARGELAPRPLARDELLRRAPAQLV